MKNKGYIVMMSFLSFLGLSACGGEGASFPTVTVDGKITNGENVASYEQISQQEAKNIMDNEIPMLSGNDLDGVSDWVDDSISKLNEILFA